MTGNLSQRDRAILAMTPADIIRFWLKVDKAPGQGPNGDCHTWTGGASGGYGRFRIADHPVAAHRVAYFLENGHLPPPETPCACHSCDWPPCVRGDHLWAGTNRDNTLDRDRKGRVARGERSGARRHPERVPRGERRPNAKLTGAMVVAIRARRGEPRRVLAQEFGVAKSTIGHVISGNSWRHVSSLVAPGAAE